MISYKKMCMEGIYYYGHRLDDKIVLRDAIEALCLFIPVDGDDKYAEGYRDGLAKAREILGGMLVE